MGKFLQMMSQNDSQALRTRAASINTQAAIAQQSLVNNLKSKKTELVLEIQNLTDFAPDSTQSLRPGVSNWNPSDWAVKLQEAKRKLYMVGIELKIAENTYKEFFEDEEPEAEAAAAAAAE